MNRNQLRDQVRARTKEVYENARAIYNLPVRFEELNISFPAAGKSSLATAWRRGLQYGMTFKIEAVEQQLDDCLYDSIPHEVAHLVNYMVPGTGRAHDAGWKQVCIALGGSGNRTSKNVEFVLTPAKFQTKYLYEASCGTEVTLSSKMHKQVQRGQVRTLRKSKGDITKTHFVRVITADEQRLEIKVKQAALAAKQGRTPVQSAPEREAPQPRQPVRQAARVPAAGKQTKADGVRSYLQRNTFSSPAEAIAGIMQQFDMKKGGASTYYYKYK